MNLAKRIYQALHSEYPDMSDAGMANMIGMGSSCLSKLKRGYGIGEVAVRWLAELNPKYNGLLAESIALQESRAVSGQKSRVKTNAAKNRKLDLSTMSPHIQMFCGYVQNR